MAFRDDLLAVLSGGLPALIDGPNVASGGATTTAAVEGSPIRPARVEEIAPSGTLQDREPFLMRVTQNQILLGTAAIIGALALLMIARR